MFICNECGETFEEPKIHIDKHPYGEGSAEEEWYLCPKCHDSHIAKAVECSRCGRYVAEDEVIYGAGAQPLCNCCFEDLYE